MVMATQVIQPSPHCPELKPKPSMEDCFGGGGGKVMYYVNIGTDSDPNFKPSEGTGNPLNGFGSGCEKAVPYCFDMDGDGRVDCFIYTLCTQINSAVPYPAYHQNRGMGSLPLVSREQGAFDPFNGLPANGVQGSSGYFQVDKPQPSCFDADGDGDGDCFVAMRRSSGTSGPVASTLH